MLIGISNLFGMAGLYIPFVYIVECAKNDVSIYSVADIKLWNICQLEIKLKYWSINIQCGGGLHLRPDYVQMAEGK